jgi:hypothetical protein
MWPCFYATAHERFQRGVKRGRLKACKTPIGKVAQARTKAVTEHMTKREHVIGSAARVGVMGSDFKSAAVVEKAIENVGRFAGSGRDDLGVIRPVLIGNVGVKRKSGVHTAAGIDFAGTGSALARAKELAVGRL